MSQRVFKSEPQAEHTLPNQAELGTSFIDWLKKNFGWLFAAAQANATLGQSYLYADDSTGLPSWALLGEYGNGGSKSTGRWEYVWLPTEDGQAIPVGVYKGGQIYALHTDHLGTPRRASNEAGSLVWQWPISGFGDNKPSGYLKATQSSRQALTNEPVLLRATSPSLELNLRYPGQYFDEETGLHYNLHRSYLPGQGRYTQADPIRLGGGSNRFGYVEGNLLSYVDPFGLETCLLTTVGLGGIRDHAAVYTSRGDGRGGPALYDPAGAYGLANQAGGGDLITGKAANIKKYKDFHKGQEVETSCKKTSRTEEESIINKAESLPSAAPFQCSIRSSTALSGHQSFPNVQPETFWPGNLRRQVRSSP